jgi:hypothetical protein
MNLSLIHNCSRRKAVWGPKRTASALLLAFACLAPSTAVAKPHHHSHEGAKKKPGVRSESIKDYKIDGELTERGRNAAHEATVAGRAGGSSEQRLT